MHIYHIAFDLSVLTYRVGLHDLGFKLETLALKMRERYWSDLRNIKREVARKACK